MNLKVGDVAVCQHGLVGLVTEVSTSKNGVLATGIQLSPQ